MREYYEQLYAKIFDNLEEMDNFLETYSLTKLNQEEIDKLNRPITRNEIEYVIKTLPTNESPGPDEFTGEFYQHTKNLNSSFLDFSKRMKKEHSPRTLFESTITLIPKTDIDTTKKKIIGQYL